MSFLLDTDVCSAFLKGNSQVWQKVVQHGGQLNVSAITVGELFTWALRVGTAHRRRQAIHEFLIETTMLDVTAAIGKRFGELRAGFLDAGQAAPDLDLLIAATALVHDLTLVTGNIQDFNRVPGLRIQNWLIP